VEDDRLQDRGPEAGFDLFVAVATGATPPPQSPSAATSKLQADAAIAWGDPSPFGAHDRRGPGDDGSTQHRWTGVAGGVGALVGRLPRGAVAAVGGVVVCVLAAMVLLGSGGAPADPDLPRAIDVGTTTIVAQTASDLAGGQQGVAGGGAASASTDATAPGRPDSVRREVVVHVAGAVVAPGVHRLAEGARVQDAVEAAGGPRPEAELDRLNLAALLVDGSQIQVPFVGAPPPAVPGGAGAPSGVGAGPISLSTADAPTLDSLPGIGPSTAAAILAHREANGPFRSVEGLLEVRGIGQAKLDGLRDLVVP